jgi:hypothetical protein
MSWKQNRNSEQTGGYGVRWPFVKLEDAAGRKRIAVWTGQNRTPILILPGPAASAANGQRGPKQAGGDMPSLMRIWPGSDLLQPGLHGPGRRGERAERAPFEFVKAGRGMVAYLPHPLPIPDPKHQEHRP